MLTFIMRMAGPEITLTVPRYDDRLYSIGEDLVSDGIKKDFR